MVARAPYVVSGNDDWLVTPQINVTNDLKVIKFWARSTSDTWHEDFNIKLSTTGNAVSNFTVNIASHTQIENAWQEYTVDLTTFVGQSVYLAIQCVSVNELAFHVDGFDWVVGDDLSGISVTGPNMPSVNTAAQYTVKIKNNGANAQSNYTVKLFADDTVVSSIPGTQIAAGATAEFSFSWTPSTTGSHTLYGKVEMTGDANTNNNQTPNLVVNVQPEGKQLHI